MPNARLRVLISGNVQGVFFRANTRDRAVKLGLTGWVRNTPDGKVEAVFEGEKERLETVLEFCREGPPGANVDKVDPEWDDYTGEFKGFEIRY
jgi:acylphosphatase